jgi:hypothetical protein
VAAELQGDGPTDTSPSTGDQSALTFKRSRHLSGLWYGVYREVG